MAAQANSQEGAGAAREAAIYVALALGLSWVVWIPALFFGAPPPLMVLGAFGPAVAAALLVRRRGGSVRNWLHSMLVLRLSTRWYLLVLVVLVLLVVAQMVAVVLRGIPLSFEVLPLQLVGFLVSVVLVSFLGGGQEEPGWRGYLLPLLQARTSSLIASLVIGLVWAVWHVPLFLGDFDWYAGGSFWVYVPLLLGFSVVLTYLWNTTGASLVAVVVLHAVVNSAGSLIPVSAEDAPALEEGVAVQAGVALALVVVAVFLVLRHGPSLGGPTDT